MNLHQYKDSKDMERVMLRKGAYLTKSIDDIHIEKRIRKIRRLRRLLTGRYRLAYLYNSIKRIF